MMGLSASLFEWLHGVLRCVFRGGRGGLERIKQRMRPVALVMGCDVQRFSVKDQAIWPVQLESLILAQNERWRQA